MNERIRELARKANMVEVEYHPGFPDIKYPANFEKFAELIVKECVHIALKDSLPDWGNAASEANAQCVKIAADLRQHFGVEE